MPFLWLGLCVFFGIVFSTRIPVNNPFWEALLLTGLVSAGVEHCFSIRSHHPLLSKTLFRIPFGMLLAAFALGGWRLEQAQPKISSVDLAFYQPCDNAVVIGTIVSFPERSKYSSVAIVASDYLFIDGEEKPVSGKLELRLPGGFHLAYGDRVKLSGKLSSTIKNNQPLYAAYLPRKGILSRMAYPHITTLAQGQGHPLMANIFVLRQRALVFLQNQLPLYESSLLSGILLGVDWNIPRFLEDAYRMTGTVHIIAISGFNIALVAALVIRLLRRIFKPWLAAGLAILAILFYTLLVGAEPSVVRAAIMGGLSLPAYLIGRRIIAINSLVFTAVVMLLINPFLLWDIGFQLSFLATLGLMVLADPLIKLCVKWLTSRFSEKSANQALPLIEIVISTLSAQFAVLPVLLNLHPVLPIYMLPANLIILPLQPPLMALGGAAVLMQFISPPLGALFARVAWVLAMLCNQTALHFAKTRFAEVGLPQYSPVMALVITTAVLFFATARQILKLTTPRQIDPTCSLPQKVKRRT